MCPGPATIDRLGAIRGPGESYSDAIIRVARLTERSEAQAASVFLPIVTTSRRLQRWWSWRAPAEPSPRARRPTRARRTLGPTVSEPTVAEIIEKAKQLCRLDGMLWSNLDFQNPMAQQRRTARMADVAARRRYLKRAQTLLETQSSTNRVDAVST